MDFEEIMSKYSPKQLAFAHEFITQGNVVVAAKAVGVSEQCAHAWLRKGLRQDLSRLKSLYVRDAMAKLEVALSDAVGVVRCLMNDPEVLASVRLNAEKTLIDSALRSVEVSELLERLAELESIIRTDD